MNAWSGDPVPERFLHGTTALERQGALVFQAKQCRNCHALGDERRTARSGARQRGGAAHAGSAHPPGDPGRRQHAGVREEPESGGDHGAGGVSRDAASGRAGAGARCFARCGSPGAAIATNHRAVPRLTLVDRLRGVSVPARLASCAMRLRSTSEHGGRAVFFSACLLIWVAVASPLLRSTAHADGPHDPTSAAHDFAPPLIWLGEPVTVVVRPARRAG